MNNKLSPEETNVAVGIDTLKIGFNIPLTRFDLIGWSRDSKDLILEYYEINLREGYFLRYELDNGSVISFKYFPYDYQRKKVNLFLIEFSSVPKVMGICSHNQPPSLNRSWNFLNKILKTIPKVPELPDVRNAVVYRVDMFKNFQVGNNVPLFLNILSIRNYPHRNTISYRGKQVIFSSKEISVSFYDKEKECKKRKKCNYQEANGILRMEIQIRSKRQLQKWLNVKEPTLGMITTELIRKRLEKDLRILKLDRPIYGNLIQRIEASNKFSRTEKKNLISYVTLRNELSRDDLKTYYIPRMISYYEKRLFEAGLSGQVVELKSEGLPSLLPLLNSNVFCNKVRSDTAQFQNFLPNYKETQMAKKRGQGEGSIYKRKDGFWVGQITIQGKHVSKYHKTQREARDWVQETRLQLQSGMTLVGAQTVLESFLSEWLVSITNSVRPKTFDQYSQIVRQHIVPALGMIKLKDLRPDQIQSLYNQRMSLGASPRTIKLIHSVLHRALGQALKWGMIGRNPAQAVNRPKLIRKEMKTLSDSQVRVLLSFSRGTRFEALYWIAVTTGLRQGELLGLKWSDVDWANRRLRVQRQVQRIRASLVFSEPKTAAGRRLIALSVTTIEVLKKHQNFQVGEIRTAGDLWRENDLIFPSTIGTPMDPSNLYHNFKHLLVKAALPNIRFHDLRHTAATLMLQQGTHPKVVQERLGHSDISMTLNTYSHVLPVMQDEAAEKMDELLRIIDVSKEIKKMEDEKSYYSPSDPNGIELYLRG